MSEGNAEVGQETSVVADEKQYQPASDPQLEKFRYKPGAKASKVSKGSVQEAKPDDTSTSQDKHPVIADEKQYQPAIDPRLEAFRFKPPKKTSS